MKQLFYNKNTGDRIQNTVISYVLYTLSCILIILSFAGLLNTYDKETETVIVLGKTPYRPYQDEYEKMLYPTVRITSSSGTGSGVVISYKLQVKSYESKPETCNLQPETFILTAAHVVDNQSVVDIELYDSTVITASVVVTDTVKDLALLRITNPPQSPSKSPQPPFAKGEKGGLERLNKWGFYNATLAPKDYTPYIFTPIYTVGCSLGLAPRPSQGIISVIGKDNWEVTSPVLPGNSGGPVYDARTFEVIGIAVWVKVYQYQLVTTMAGIVPIQEIYKFLDNHPAKDGINSDTKFTEN